jgi:hypothetical protein
MDSQTRRELFLKAGLDPDRIDREQLQQQADAKKELEEKRRTLQRRIKRVK